MEELLIVFFMARKKPQTRSDGEAHPRADAAPAALRYAPDHLRSVGARSVHVCSQATVHVCAQGVHVCSQRDTNSFTACFRVEVRFTSALLLLRDFRRAAGTHYDQKLSEHGGL